MIGHGPPRSPNITLRRRLATGLACSVRAFGGPHCAPHKIGIETSCFDLSCRGRPALATATHGPTGIVPSGRAGDESAAASEETLEHCLAVLTFKLRTSSFTLQRSVVIIPARASPPLGGTLFGRSDTPRTPLLFPVGTLLDALKMIGFDDRYSMFAASCSRRVRLASLPSRPSSARRPCTRYLSSHLLWPVRTSLAIPTENASSQTRLHQPPTRFKRWTHPAKTLRRHRAAATQSERRKPISQRGIQLATIERRLVQTAQP